MDNALHVVRLRKQIHEVCLLDPITGGPQGNQIASQRGRIARNVNDAWRTLLRQRARHALSQAAAGRIYHREVGHMKEMSRDRALPDPPRTLPTAQKLLRRGLDQLSMRWQIVNKIFGGNL